MPEAVRTVGLWIGRLKRSLRDTREEIERQMGVDDIRRQLRNEEIMQTLENARRDFHNVIEHGENAMQEATEEFQKEYHSEPELPYHSHGDETSTTEQVVELLSIADTPEPKATAVKLDKAAPAITPAHTEHKVNL